MGEAVIDRVSQVSSTPELEYLDLVSSNRVIPKQDMVRFNPAQITLAETRSLETLTPVDEMPKEVIETTIKANDAAKESGVDISKSDIFRTLTGVVITGTGLGIAIVGTVLTGGAGLPLAILAGVGFTLAVADAGCAFADWRGKSDGGEGLVMGSDAIANAVNAILGKMAVVDDKAQLWAKGVSITSRLALVVANLWTGFLMPSSAVLPGNIEGIVSGTSNTVVLAINGLDDVFKLKSAKKAEQSEKKRGSMANDIELQLKETQLALASLGITVEELVKKVNSNSQMRDTNFTVTPYKLLA